MVAVIFPDGIYIIMRQGMIVTGDIPEDLEIITIITVEPIEGAKP